MTTNQSKRSIRSHFNRHARDYDDHANIQRDLANWMLETLPVRESTVHRILEIGCGTGYVTERLVSMFPHARIVAVDIAPAMLEMTAAKIGPTSRVFYLEHDIEHPLPEALSDFLGVPPIGAFDLIISSGTLQWLERPEETLALLAQALQPQGELHVSLFGAQTFRELSDSFAIASRGQGTWSHGPLLRSSQEWEQLCKQAGIGTTNVQSKTVKNLYPSVQHFLKGIQKSGANNAANSDAVCRRPSVVRAMMEVYRNRFGTEEGVYATWEFICITKAGTKPFIDSTALLMTASPAPTQG